MARNTSNGEVPASLDPDTKRLPAERFANAMEVMDCSNLLIRADDPRATNRSRVQGIIDGNRPYNQSVLVSNGQGWRGNVNYREGEGQVQAQRTPYYDLVTEVNPCIQLEVEYGSSQQQADWASKIARRFHQTLFGWDSFDWHTQLQQSEMLVHGYGTHLRLSAYDWRPVTKTMRHVLFPDRTTSDLDESLEYFVVREPMLAHQLYRKIANEEAARQAGWKPEAVRNAIVRASTVGNGKGRQRSNPEEVQRRLKNGDMGYGYAASRETWLNHIFVREFEGGHKNRGGISQYTIEENQGDEYLFVRRNRFVDWSEVITLFPYDIGSDGTIHSIRGLGTRIYPFLELSNRLKNHMVDSVLVGSGVLLTSKQQVDMTRMQLTSIGPMKLLPPGVEPANYKAMDLAQGPLALSRELQQTMDENNKTYRQSADGVSAKERTAYEVSVNQADSAKLLKSAHNMYYRQLGKHYRETLRRLCNPNYQSGMAGGEEAVEFQRRCFKDGVPKEALAKIVSVEATRSLGAGSASARIAATQALMNVIYPSTTNELARNNMMRDFVASLTGYATVDRYVPEINSQDIPNNDDAMAVLENDALIAGGEAIVTDKQDHVRHANRHIGKGAELLKAIKQGMPPQQVLAAWNAMGPHIAAHLIYVQKDPTKKGQFDQLNKNFMAMSKMADKLQQHLEAQAQAAESEQVDQELGGGEPQQPQDPAMLELQLKAQEIQNDFQAKMAKLQAEIGLKTKKTDADIARKDRAQMVDSAVKVAGAKEKKSLPYKRGGGNTKGE